MCLIYNNKTPEILVNLPNVIVGYKVYQLKNAEELRSPYFSHCSGGVIKQSKTYMASMSNLSASEIKKYIQEQKIQDNQDIYVPGFYVFQNKSDAKLYSKNFANLHIVVDVRVRKKDILLFGKVIVQNVNYGQSDGMSYGNVYVCEKIRPIVNKDKILEAIGEAFTCV